MNIVETITFLAFLAVMTFIQFLPDIVRKWRKK